MRLPERYRVRYQLPDGAPWSVDVSAWNRTEAGAKADGLMRAEHPGAQCIEVTRYWRLDQPPERPRRRRPVMTDDDDRFDVRAVAAALTFVLSDWTLVPPDATWPNMRQAHATLKRGEATLELSRAWKDKSRLHVSAGFPHGYTRISAGIESISVDPTKPATQIARDIERRILKAYLPKLEEVLKERAADEAKKARCRAVVAELARALRCHDPTTEKNPRGRTSDGPTESWTLYPGDPVYSVTVSSWNPDRIEFKEVRCTTREQALQLAALLYPAGKRKKR